MEQIKVSIEGKHYSVIGGDFWEMLEKVKSIPGRKMLPDKVWSLPVTLDGTRAQLAPLQVVDEDGLLDAEIADIQRVQSRIQELRPRIEMRISDLDSEVRGYSRNSVSSIKAGKARGSAMLSHALDYATMPVEKLTEPQIKTIYAALRDMEN